MRISELAERGGVTVATVKYYLREGLLPPGTPVSARMADYGESHLERLRLLRLLREAGRVPIARLKAVTRAVDAGDTFHDVFGAASDALAPEPRPPGPQRDEALAQVEGLLATAQWEVRASSPDREHLAGVLETISELLGHPLPDEVLAPYVRAADDLARWEIAHLDLERGRAGVLRQMAMGQVLLGEALMALRRLAEESYSSRRFGRGPSPRD